MPEIRLPTLRNCQLQSTDRATPGGGASPQVRFAVTRDTTCCIPPQAYCGSDALLPVGTQPSGSDVVGVTSR